MAGTTTGMKRYSVQEAATLLGMSERGIRKRVEAKTLAAERDGHKWWILLPVLSVSENGTATESSVEIGTANGTVPGHDPEHRNSAGNSTEVSAASIEAIIQLLREEKEHIRQLEQVNMELAGQVGYLQGQLQVAHETIKQLEAPVEEPADQEEGQIVPEQVELPPRSWWQFWKL